MTAHKFKARFCHSPSELRWFFNQIKEQAVRPLETMHHSRNKLLLLMDRLHCCLSSEEMSDKFHIGCKTAYSHCSDIVHAILKTYTADTDVIAFPTKSQRVKMVEILKRKGRPAPTALFAVDGSDTRCTGRHIMERLSRKYKWYVFLHLPMLSCSITLICHTGSRVSKWFVLFIPKTHICDDDQIVVCPDFYHRALSRDYMRCQPRAGIHNARYPDAQRSCLVSEHRGRDGWRSHSGR